MTVDKSRNPYYDDYSEQKNFHEVLFVPSRAVQVRELNQIQSMFYEQMSRFADHTFEDGSVVIPGEYNYDLSLNYITVDLNNINNSNTLLSGNAEVKIVGVNTGIEATRKLYRSPVNTDPATIYLEYGKPSDDKTKTKFSANDNIEVYVAGDLIDTGTIIGEGQGSKLTINSGVYYIEGRFVLVEQQTVMLDKYSSTPSKVVCIEYNENVTTENDDNSLFDNAQGTPNFTAPGAHRLKIDTRLVTFDLADSDTIPDNCVEIFRIENGNVLKTYRGPNYSILGDVLAQRTYEESGDYTVKSFNIGFDTHDRVFGTVDDTKAAVQLDSGIAYVRGYRIETTAKTNIPIDKARDVNLINNSSISASLGYYIEVNNLTSIPSVSALQTITFIDGATTPVELGTARVRFVSNPSTGVYRLYLFDAKNTTGIRTTDFVSNAVGITSNDTVSLTADLVESSIQEASFNSLLFSMNVDFVKTLNTNNGNPDTSYASVKQVTGNTDTSGQVTFSASTSEVFVAQDSRFAFGVYTDDNTFIDVSSNYTLGGTPTGSVITIDLGAGNASRPVQLNIQVAKQEVVQKIKSLTQATVSGALTNGSLSLGKADGYRIVSVTDNEANDVTELFDLNINKTPSFYGTSSVNTSSTVAEPITVVFDYFSHSAGDYFGPDSYVDLAYEDIPTENGVRLSDLIDFRPRMNDAGTGFTGAGSSVGNIPTPFTIIRTDLEHYLNRIDKVYVDSSGEFGIAKGVPDIDPSEPSDPSDAMVLYTLYVPAYTFDISDVQAEKVNNRRYTMKDIGTIETRLSNVEYYVSLNLLEQEADSIQVPDPATGANRFKNGFFTDQFIDHGSADFAWEGYHVSVSDETSELRPEFSLNAIDLQLNAFESSNIVVNDNMVTLPFEEVSYVKQNQRSETMNVNPYAIYRWSGSLKLNPNVDSWIDVNYTNPDVTYRVFNNGRLTQTWKSWELNWTGGVTSSSRSFTRRSAPHAVFQPPNAGGQGAWGDGAWRDVFGGRRRAIDTFRTTRTTRTNIDVVNDRVIDTSVIPFMRSIDVELTGKGNRPLCKMNFFFDDESINEFVKPTGANYGDDVVTDIDGNFDAVFTIPNNDEDRFRTGEKSIVATDEESNEQQLSTSYAQSNFTSTGNRQTRQRTIIATRSTTSNQRRTRRTWDDPLAQSFLIEQRGGAFITRINTFFSTKDANVPVAVQIREMENGLPTQSIVPGGEKLLLPSEVSLSDDGSVPTSFVFDHPIYLQDGQEYCFVLFSNSNQYNVHVGRMGEQDVGTGRFIVRQPYAGVLFKSQNNSTWTEDQQADLQFEIFAAKFDTSVVGLLTTDSKDLVNIRLRSNPIETTLGSSDVLVRRPNHNYTVNTILTISGATGGNDIPATELNGDHVVTEVVDPNRVKISVTTPAIANGTIGGENVEVSDTIQASLLNPNIPVLDLPNTGLEFAAKGTTGKSIDGNELPYQVQASYVPIDNQTINNLKFPWLITNRNDETTNTSGQNTFKMQAVLTSTNENVSPLIDLSGASIITPYTQVTKNQTIEPNGSNNWANYRSRINPLVSPADMVRCYMDINTIDPSNVVMSIRSANSEEEMADAEWIQIPSITNDVPADGSSYYEYEFEKTGLSEFSFYQIMIQLKSNSAVDYPKCQRLRVLALSDFS